jgi:hypothetical protein
MARNRTFRSIIKANHLINFLGILNNQQLKKKYISEVGTSLIKFPISSKTGKLCRENVDTTRHHIKC